MDWWQVLIAIAGGVLILWLATDPGLATVHRLARRTRGWRKPRRRRPQPAVRVAKTMTLSS